MKALRVPLAAAAALVVLPLMSVAGAQDEDRAAVCGLGEKCVCEPVESDVGPAFVVNLAELEEGESICPLGFVIVVDSTPAAIQASPS